MRKIPRRLRGTNFCTSSARFAPSFISQPNGPQCTKILRNALEYEFRVQWYGSGVFISKNFDATSSHELLYQFGPFRTEFVSQPNGPKCTKIVRNAPKHEFRVQWGGTGAFVAKNSEATSWHELLHQFGLFCTEFRKSTKRSQCPKIIRNAPKYEFRVQWGGSGAFVAKNSEATSWHDLLHQFGPFAPIFIRQPNGPKCT